MGKAQSQVDAGLPPGMDRRMGTFPITRDHSVSMIVRVTVAVEPPGKV